MLMNCVVYQDGKKIKDISVEEIAHWVQRSDSFVWVALRDAEPQELEHMQAQFGLHPLAVEDARHGHQRPKIEEYGESLFAVLHLPEFVNGELQIGEVNVFMGNNYVLSVRTRSESNFLGVRARAEREPELLKQGPSFVVYALMDAVVDRYFPILDALEIELEDIETRIFKGNQTRANIESLYELKGKTMKLRHAVAPLMDATTKLFGGRVPPACAQTQDYFRDVHDHLTRLNAAVDAMRDTIATAIQVNISFVAIDQSDVSKRLAAWAAIFGVATAFAGIWGMNFDHMPELKWAYSYPAALGFIAGACGILYVRFKKMKWL